MTLTIGAQENTAVPADDSALVGLTLKDLFSRFGAPESVYAIRGSEAWQDDVVFVYQNYDFYVYKDHVWQVGVKSAFGVKIGDSRGTVLLALDEEKRHDFDTCILFPLPSHGWPLMLRLNFDNAEKTQAIFIYRPDV
jgi:hypothetical protein